MTEVQSEHEKERKVGEMAHKLHQGSRRHGNGTIAHSYVCQFPKSHVAKQHSQLLLLDFPTASAAWQGVAVKVGPEFSCGNKAAKIFEGGICMGGNGLWQQRKFNFALQ